MNADELKITKLLKDWNDGDREAFDKLFPVVYKELHKRASQYLRNERRGHTLQTTALINEAYVNLVDKDDIEWESRSHFYAIASKAMRRILVDHARAKRRKKRGGGIQNLPLDEARYVSSKQEGVDLVEMDEALERLGKFDERQARIVELKYFCGMTNDETADVLGISNATVRREWNVAKLWLHKQLKN